MTKAEVFRNVIISTLKENNIKYEDSSESTSKVFGLDIKVIFEDNIFITFLEVNNGELFTCIIVDDKEDEDFNLEDYTNRKIKELQFKYKFDVDVENFIASLQRKLNYIPKNYVAPTEHRYINGKMIY